MFRDTTLSNTDIPSEIPNMEVPQWSVLVVEDDEGLNSLIQKKLSKAGFVTLGALNGRDAIKALDKKNDILALIDQNLPDMSGTDLIKTLQQNNTPVPFVAMTGYGDERTAVDMMKLGARDYLIKGFELTDQLPELFKRICRELETETRLAVAESALKTSQQRFSMAMEAVHDGLCDVNLETGESYLSPICSTMLGYSGTESLTEVSQWIALVHPDDLGNLIADFENCAQDKLEAYNVEYRILSKTQGWLWILSRGKVVERNEQGRASRIIGTHTDITDNKRVEEKLASQAANLNTIFDSTPSILILVNEERRVEKINHNGISFSGKNENDILGHLGGEVFNCLNSFGKDGCGFNSGCSDCPISTRLDNTLEAGTSFHEEEGEMSFLLDDKETVQQLLISTVLLVVEGKRKALVTLTNISSIKQAEQERQLLEKQLHQTQKLQSVGTLAGGIAHDFNNILTSIMGWADIIKTEHLSNTALVDDIDQILQSSFRAKELVEQILIFSRQSDSKRMPLQPCKAIEDSLKMIRPSFPSSIEVNQEIFQTGLISVNPTKLHQVIMNVCTNAYHAMGDKGGKLHISVKETTFNSDSVSSVDGAMIGTFAQISIGDTGHGIDKETKTKIFDPFFTTKEMGRGTGMGLSIVHGIVYSYDGFISVDSELDKGTTIHIFLPIVHTISQPTKTLNESMTAGNEKILFVDDEEVIGEMSKKMLERLGYQVTVESSSLEALETFRQQSEKFDLVITDQTMPSMSGTDLSKNIIAIREDIPIILCTGHTENLTENSVKSIGIKGFATKPFTKNEMALLIRETLDK